MPIDLPPIPQIEQRYEKTDSGLLKPKKNIFMPGMGSVLSGAMGGQQLTPAQSFSYGSSYWTTSDLTTYSSTLQLPFISGTRHIFITMSSRANSGRTIVSALLAGSSMTQLDIQTASENGTHLTSLYHIQLNSGTSATVSFTFSGNMAWFGMSSYVCANIQSTTATDSTYINNSTDGQVEWYPSVSVNAGGIALMSLEAGSSSAYWTISNMTIDRQNPDGNTPWGTASMVNDSISNTTLNSTVHLYNPSTGRRMFILNSFR